MAKKTKAAGLSIEEKLEQALIVPGYEPYQLPENWCWVRIDSVSGVFTGNSINERIKAEKYTGRINGLVYIATKDIGFDSIIDYDTNVYIPKDEGFKIAPKGSTLLCIEGGSAGRKIGIVSQDVCFVNKLCAFVPMIPLLPKYLFYAIQSEFFKKQFDAKKHGLIGGVSLKDVAANYIPLAPLAQQKIIVDRIESLLSKLDEAKEKAQAVIDSFETRKAAILHKAFSGELTAKWREENGVGIESWKRKTINDLCHSLKYGTSKKSNAEGAVIVIRMGNLQQGEIDWTDLAYTDDQDDIEKYRLYPGDVLFNRTNSAILVGKTSIYRGDYPAIYAGYLIKLDYNREIIVGDYLNYALNTTDAKEYCNSVKTDGVNQSNINAKKIGAYAIPVASITEQKEIIRVIDSMLGKLKESKQLAAAVIEQIDKMKKAVLSRAFCGELGTNDPSEESAVELLKTILSGNTYEGSESKPKRKRVVIPQEVAALLKTELEKKIMRLFYKSENGEVSAEEIMAVSSKKFDVLNAIRMLESNHLIHKEENNSFVLAR